MSAATASYKNNATAKVGANAYCDVCFKKGLDESVYKSHFTKTSAGVVCCPTILATVCRYCGKNGHWANEKFCAAMRSDAKNGRLYEMKKFDVKKKSAPPAPERKNHKQLQNSFAVLNDDSDDEDVVVVAPAPVLLPKAGISWADMAKKPAVAAPVVENVLYYTQREESKEPIMTASEKEAYKILLERRASGYFDRERISWSQMMDEEDEDW